MTKIDYPVSELSLDDGEIGTDYILVRDLPPKTHTDGGLVLPDRVQEDRQSAWIIKTGRAAAEELARRFPALAPISPGDIVTYIPHSRSFLFYIKDQDGKPVKLYAIDARNILWLQKAKENPNAAETENND